MLRGLNRKTCLRRSGTRWVNWWPATLSSMIHIVCLLSHEAAATGPGICNEHITQGIDPQLPRPHGAHPVLIIGFCIIIPSGAVDSLYDTLQADTLDTVSLERDGRVLLIGLNRPEKHNAFTAAMLADLSHAYALLETEDALRAGVLFGHGDHFIGGLDLVDVGPKIVAGETPLPEDGRDPC
jgi:hypothetical protein